MLKRYCNVCKKEIKGTPIVMSTVVRRYKPFVSEIDIDFCEDCFKAIIGQDLYEELEAKKAEKDADIARRRQERAKGTEQ